MEDDEEIDYYNSQTSSFLILPTLYHLFVACFRIWFRIFISPWFYFARWLTSLIWDELEPFRTLFAEILSWNWERYFKLFFLFGFITSTTLTISIITYLSLYQIFMPYVLMEIPVYFQFDTSNQGPETSIYIDPNFFYEGQQYSIFLQLHLPESPENIHLGMFMAEVELYSNNTCIRTSRRPGLFHFKSKLLRIINTLFYSFPLVLGYFHEDQILKISLIEDLRTPFEMAHLSLSKSSIQIYESFFIVQVQLYGFRWIAYNWFLSSFFFGVSTLFVLQNVFLLFLFFTCYWYLGKDKLRTFELSEVQSSSEEIIENEEDNSLIENEEEDLLKIGEIFQEELVKEEDDGLVLDQERKEETEKEESHPEEEGKDVADDQPREMTLRKRK